MWSIRSHASWDMNSGPWVPVSLCYTAAWWMKSAQKRERYSGDIYGHLHYLEASYGLEDKDDLQNNVLLWMTRTGEFLDLPVHPKEMAFDCQLFIPCMQFCTIFLYLNSCFAQSLLNPLLKSHCMCLVLFPLSLCSQGHKWMLCDWRPLFPLKYHGFVHNCKQFLSWLCNFPWCCLKEHFLILFLNC